MTLKAKRYVSPAMVVLGLVLLAGPVNAAPAPAGVPRGTILVSAERLFGLSFGRTSVETGGGRQSWNFTTFSLFTSAPTTVHMVPRVAFDFALVDGLTLGGSLGFAVGEFSSVTTAGGDTDEAEGPSSTTVVVSPRLGYALGLGRAASLWLRGGVTYYWMNAENPPSPNRSSSVRDSGLSFDLEPTVLISASDHLAFTAGFLVNLPVTGTRTSELVIGPVTTTTSVDLTFRNIALVAGMVGVF